MLDRILNEISPTLSVSGKEEPIYCIFIFLPADLSEAESSIISNQGYWKQWTNFWPTLLLLQYPTGFYAQFTQFFMIIIILMVRKIINKLIYWYEIALVNKSAGG